MKTILLEVDEATANAFSTMNPENKQQFLSEATEILKRILADERSMKLKRIVDEIRNEGDTSNLDPDILTTLLNTEL
jgi:fructose-1,6-bisphosphatase